MVEVSPVIHSPETFATRGENSRQTTQSGTQSRRRQVKLWRLERRCLNKARRFSLDA